MCVLCVFFLFAPLSFAIKNIDQMEGKKIHDHPFDLFDLSKGLNDWSDHHKFKFIITRDNEKRDKEEENKEEEETIIVLKNPMSDDDCI